MATGTRICKICGKEYPYCKTEAKRGVFRYQDVACCPEHGSQYFAEIMASRTESDKSDNNQAVKDNTREQDPVNKAIFDVFDFIVDNENEDDEDELEDEDELDY